MPVIDTLSVALEGLTADLSNSLIASLADIDSFTSNANSKLGAIKTPELAIASPSIGGSSGSGGMGGDIAKSIAQSLTPLNSFAERFEKSFDRVGGTIVALAHRIDSAMKFPALDGFLTKVQEKLPAGFAKSSVSAIQSLARIKNFLGSIGNVSGKGLSGLHLGVSNSTISSYSKLALTITGITPAANAATRAAKGLGGQIALSLGIFSGVGAIVAFFTKGIKGASDLGETVSKTNEVFKDSSGIVKKQADEMAKLYGLPKKELLDGASAIGLVAKASGASEASAAGMSNQFIKLAADVASFYNIPMADALAKIRSGLVGEAEPLRSLGVLLSEDAVNAEALRMGLVKGNEELTDAQKVTARAALITKGLADASGDLERTSGSTANQLRKFTGSAGNLATVVGGSVLPAIDSILAGVNSFTSVVGAWVERNQAAFTAVGFWLRDAFVNFGEGLSAIIGGLSKFAGEVGSYLGITSGSVSDFGAKVANVVDGIGFAWRNLPEIIGIVWIRIKEFGINTVATFEALLANASTFAGYLATNWRALIVDAFQGVIAVVWNLGKNLASLGSALVQFLLDPMSGFHVDWTPLLDGFKATAEKLPAMIQPSLVSLQGEVDTKLATIATNEVARAERIAKEIKAKTDAITPKRPTAVDNKGLEQSKKERSELVTFAKSLTDKSRDPIEKYNEQIRKIGEAFKYNLINENTYLAAHLKAQKELNNVKGSGKLLTLGSEETREAILSSQTGRSEGMKGLAKTALESLAQERQTNTHLAKIATSLGAPAEEVKM